MKRVSFGNEREFKALVEQCFEKWGIESQIIILGEEQGELFKAISHLYRNTAGATLSHVKEEMADVLIMIFEFMVELKIEIDDLDKIITFKLNRLKKRVEE